MEYREMNFAEDEDRTEWDRGWRERPLRQLVNPVQIDVAPTADPAWGKLVRVEVAADPPQFSDTGYRNSEICPVCGDVTSAYNQIAATIYPYFDGGFSYSLPCWVHEACLVSCEEIAGPAPVPW
jgi:hypothetical protein